LEPAGAAPKGRQVEEAYNRVSAKLGRTPNETDLARALGLRLEELQSLLAELDSLEIGSLRVESAHTGKEEDLSDSIAAKQEETPFFQCLRSEMKHLLAEAIAELPEKEQRVLSLYYFEELTMKEVGAVLGIGESRVSQIHSIAMVRLRARLSFLDVNVEPSRSKSAGAS
jgi:RNA polymerase sigma factor for flagellar operon FliA